MNPFLYARDCNIKRYQDLLDSSVDATERQTLHRLLAEERGQNCARTMEGTVSAVQFPATTPSHQDADQEALEREVAARSAVIGRGGDGEIGRLAVASNDTLPEVAAVRAQENSDQPGRGHVARFSMMGGMAASVAHELKQSLTAISANASAGLGWLARATPDVDEARLALGNIVGNVDRATQVIGSIRSIFNRDDHNRRLINVNDLIPDVLALAHGRLTSHRIAVSVELDEKLPPVLADRVQLQQVILNLIMNGVDAMAAINDRPRSFSIKSETRQPSDVLVTLQDAGTGIGPDDMDRIFDPFFTTKSSGMGIGLFICRSIIDAHGGRLWASAGIPYGSAFHVVLPSADNRAVS
jgi:C4-dicarboxylate-specific signal transduction histidine kinase